MQNAVVTDEETADYWTAHNVTSHKRYPDAQASLDYLAWRNDQYWNYKELMPVAGYDGKAILDYGCGPGNDLVGFSVFSKPQRLVGADISSSSLAEAADRLALHHAKVELVQIKPEMAALPWDDASFDHIHCIGVLHHAPDPGHLLRELRRIVRPGGDASVLVYHYDSLWVHLYVAYVKQIAEGLWRDEDVRSAFRRTTDGPDCPISNVYTVPEWTEICAENGWKAEFTGSAVSLHECNLLARRFEAAQHPDLPSESREFLLSLEFDRHGYPMSGGRYAGVDGCYRLTPA